MTADNKRTIKFRGQRVDNKEWVYGLPLFNKLGAYIITEENPHECTQYSYIEIDQYAKVIPSTVGQFTGLKDKNGNDIYEGDYDENYDVVAWCEKRNGWAMWLHDLPTNEFIECHCYRCAGDFEIDEVVKNITIIGNLHSSPELLQK